MSRTLTAAEVEASLRGLSKQIERYAELAVCKGVNIQPGQELVITAPVERADFVRTLVSQAYGAGAGHVTTIWSDDELARLEYRNVPLAYFEEVPSWKREQLNSLAAMGAAFLMVRGSDPRVMSDVDPQKLATLLRAQNTQCAVYREGLDFGKNAWTIMGAPVEGWACAVFPDCPPREALWRLWNAILVAARADGPNPQGEWERHNATFEKNKRLLNEHAFCALRYRSANGTDFELGLNKGHVWEGGAARTVGGTVFFPNMPTEEVFTSPNRNRAHGVVHSALPLVYGSRTIEDFWLRFEDGKVVDFNAKTGCDALRSIVETDDNSCRLGECALVSKDTPIRQSGLLFYDTLYDENASCHLALGTGFPECIQGGASMSRDELVAHGINQSGTHVDFMIGSDDLDIWGVTETGEEIPVFRDGRWAWQVA